METIYQYTGQVCSGYLAPALSHSEVTMDLFAEVGSELFGEGVGFIPATFFMMSTHT